MTTITINSTPSHQYLLANPYTGTIEQPDTVSLFFRSGKRLDIVDENIINGLAYSPLAYFHNLHSTLWRIQEAALKIIASIKGESNDLQNAFKNLGRGIVQLFPILGGAALYMYDLIKTNLYTHPEIASALAYGTEPEGSVLGIAFDGKIIAKFSLEEFASCLNRNNNHTTGNPEKPLAVLNYMWLHLLTQNYKSNCSNTRHAIAISLTDHIKRA